MFRKRILANIIDVMVADVFFCLIGIFIFYDEYILIEDNLDKIYYVIYLICLLLLFISFLGKDLIKGQSLGKKIIKIRVVNMRGETPNIFLLFLRNITFFIWPMEVFLWLLDKRRIGDIIARTTVVEC